MKLLIIILLVFFSLIRSAEASGLTDNFNQANDYYNKGDYPKAIQAYDSILKIGYESAEIYFNIANAYYKMNKIPESILYYERARKIAPEDEDINFNLKIANLKIVDKFEELPKFFITEWIENIRDMYSSEGWSTIFLIILWITFLSIAGFIISWNLLLKRSLFFLALFSLFISLTSVYFAQTKYYDEKHRQTAIIFSPRVDVKSSPDEKGTVLFILHEGTKVELLDSVGEWNQIKISRGDVGWIVKNSFELI